MRSRFPWHSWSFKRAHRVIVNRAMTLASAARDGGLTTGLPLKPNHPA
jgi:hypothetical protein